MVGQAGLFEDAALGGQGQILLGVRHRHLARLRWMLELVVGAHYMHQKPAIRLEQFDNVSAFHGLIIHTITQNMHMHPQKQRRGNSGAQRSAT